MKRYGDLSTIVSALVAKGTKIKRVKNLSSSEVLRHWMLNTAIDFEVRLTDFFPELNSQGLNVRPVPGCRSEQYANALIELFDSDLISFSSQVEGDDTRSRNGILRMIERFRNLRKTDPSLLSDNGRLLKSYQLCRLPGMQVSFKLTSLGGEAWEKIASPDWTHYVSESTVFPALDDQNHEALADGDLTSADRDRIIAYMGWYPEVRGEYIEVDTVNWQTHTDFEILYWKRVPFVHHASFRVRVAEGRWQRCLAPKWFGDWWASTRKWHIEPWDLSNWPSG